MNQRRRDEMHRVEIRAEFYRAHEPAFAGWAAGYGVIAHDDLTQVRVREMAEWLRAYGAVESTERVYEILAAADKVANAAMWLTVHMTYADRVHLDGRGLAAEDFKKDPQGHTGGALNMAIAYTGYFAANAATGVTRSWVMGQGHTVAAIDAANLILDNMTEAHAKRYSLTDEGLTRFVRDFYLRKAAPDGTQVSPLGSHVNAHTAGGTTEGGYLGFAELYYPHMPLPGERLVAFLSDGAFEEQRGADWAPRWWRAQDTGLVAPIMIANGRRIDQRTSISMTGGVNWLRDHLRLNNFEPIDISGADPAAYAWAIWEMEERLGAHADAVKDGHAQYPVPLPYTIAEVAKGFAFAAAGTNAAHNLPLGEDVRGNPAAIAEFNDSAKRLWVPPGELKQAVATLKTHEKQKRPQERDHALVTRKVETPAMPEPQWADVKEGRKRSPMKALDEYFCTVVKANPSLRVRVGNPDEMRSNRLDGTLDMLKHRVTAPEAGIAEAVDGKVITVLNEEAVVSAALANKAGLNLVATYEAFGVKMLGAMRQEIIWNRHLAEAGRPAGWLGVPVVLTSHTWENGKNERSHQDTTLCEALMAEMTDMSRAAFAADANSAVALLREAYRSKGNIWGLVIPKGAVRDALDGKDAERAVAQGGAVLRTQPGARLVLAAVGAYQLEETTRASKRLDERGVTHNVVCLVEPTRFRKPRDAREAAAMASEETRRALFPEAVQARVFVSHTRPEALMGALRPLDTGHSTRALGFINHGGTFDVFAMLFANRCTWAHVVEAAAEAMGGNAESLLTREELDAVRGRGDPEALR